MKYNLIAMEREYGSGGTEIARRLSAQTGVPCYGREIVETVATEQRVPVEVVERYEERATGSLLYSLYMMAQAATADPGKLTAEGRLFLAEQKVIRRLAEQGSAIFVGHCAAEALHGRGNVLRVFVRADLPLRVERAVKEYALPKESAEATVRRFDKKRAGYYYANTARKWDDPRGYDLMPDSGALGLDGCVAALKGLMGR